MKDYYELVLENALLKSALFKVAANAAVAKQVTSGADPSPSRLRRIIEAIKGMPGSAWEKVKGVPGWVKEHPYKATAYGVGGLSALGGLAALPFLLGGEEEEVAPPPPPGLLEQALGFVREHPYLTGGVAAGAVGLPLLALLAARRRRRRRRD